MTAIFVVGIGGVFVFFIGLGGPLQSGGANAVVAVGPYHIGIAEFERERARREDQYREALGDRFDARSMRDSVDALTARDLVQRAVLALEAERLGLTVAKQEIEREVQSASIFRDASGRFDKESFDDWVSYNYGSERNFRDQQRRAALARKLLRALSNQARVSVGEARLAVIQRLERIRIAFVMLEPEPAAEDFSPEPAALEAFFATREADTMALYEERADVYDVPEQTRARHILFRIPADANETRVAEVEQRAAEVLKRLREGADFAALAAENSDDPGSKANGGDLGFFRRGQMAEPFERAAFSLEPGTLSEPVRTVFGIHIILVEERKSAQQRGYEAVREELASELLAAEAGRAAIQALSEELAGAVRDGRSLEEAARGAGLTLERSGWLARRADGFVPTLGAAQELMAVAFTLEPTQSSDRVFEVGEKLALVQLLERQEPAPEEIEAEVAAERLKLAEQRRSDLIDSWVLQRQAELAEQGQLSINLTSLGR
jgi:peptidyl-prolyl cis-trans isomerase D